ncbi:MAG: hypothetical protein ACK492_02270 [Chitinophagaceae bacterium]|jgi:hypothetical protein
MNQNSKKPVSQISVKELLDNINDAIKYLKSKWKKIFLFSTLGAVLGFSYAFLVPIKYVSKLTFVVEESRSGGGGLAAIAGQFGLDLGGMGGGGVLSGDNILLFLKSESLLREALLTAYDENGSITLADKYIESKKWKKSWNQKFGEINFAKYQNGVLPRHMDSLMQKITLTILLNGELNVSKPDKKASLVDVRAIMVDEKLSYLFSKNLVSIAIEKFVQSKIKVKAANVKMLQDRADSLGRMLNIKTYAAASSQQSLIDANPAIRSAPIGAEISAREKTMVGTIFAEVVKNLEISKTILNQETPVIQMVDLSSMPLRRVKVSKLNSLLIGGILMFLFTSMALLIMRWYKSIHINQ